MEITIDTVRTPNMPQIDRESWGGEPGPNLIIKGSALEIKAFIDIISASL